MTRRLILMRHAKSSWDDLALDDHARRLNKRGRASAKALGNWLRKRAYLPHEILCSSSARTQETCALLELDAPVTVLDGLYLASTRQLRDALHGATGNTVLVVAHNPGIATFAAQVVSRPPDHVRFFDYPTGATLVVDFNVDNWRDATTGRAVDFVVPRDLLD
ncbi:SixA phosphatase family protein [Pseudaestuariivita atlantica]|uniref:Phosphoglycerate mutase n=1 Tax=Pseudaestuariivita atlantica TaxID=1317121 RepID=A0A0L1JKL3_9RHOB|nr:histidine phosphatase family protein [Pseudaestuariivita atlantica]KNG92295.1 phosphoglycerate mutase [Pseudaestuariivita atlantica]